MKNSEKRVYVDEVYVFFLLCVFCLEFLFLCLCVGLVASW